MLEDEAPSQSTTAMRLRTAHEQAPIMKASQNTPCCIIAEQWRMRDPRSHYSSPRRLAYAGFHFKCIVLLCSHQRQTALEALCGSARTENRVAHRTALAVVGCRIDGASMTGHAYQTTSNRGDRAWVEVGLWGNFDGMVWSPFEVPHGLGCIFPRSFRLRKQCVSESEQPCSCILPAAVESQAFKVRLKVPLSRQQLVAPGTAFFAAHDAVIADAAKVTASCRVNHACMQSA